MNTRTKVAIIVVAIVLLAYPAAAWVTGLIVEGELQRGEQAALDKAPYVSVIQRTYHRGVYSATEEVTYGFRGPFAQSLGSEALSKLRLTVRNTIYHGPLPRLRTAALATIDSDLVLPPELHKRLDAMLSGKPIVTIQTRMSFFGGHTTWITSPAFTAEVSPGTTLSSRGIAATADATRKMAKWSIDLTANGFSIQGAKGKGELDNLRVKGSMQKAYGTMDVGTLDLSADRLEVQPTADTAETPSSSVSMEHLTVSSRSALAGDFVNMSAELKIGALHAAKFAGTNLGYSFAATHVHGPSLAALTDDLRAAQRDAYTTTGTDATAAASAQTKKFLEVFRKDGVDILLHDPVFELPHIGFVTPEGELRMSAKFTAPGLKREDFQGEGRATMAAIVQHLQASADLRVDTALLDKLLEGNPNSDKVAAQARALEGQGYITRDGNALTAHLVFEHGKLSVNGHPFPPGPPTR